LGVFIYLFIVFSKVFRFQERVIELEAYCGMSLSFLAPKSDEGDGDDVFFDDVVDSVYVSYSTTMFLPQLQVHDKSGRLLSADQVQQCETTKRFQ
jgi:hypothetical protein